MSDKVKRVKYFHVEVRDQPGEGFRVLSVLKEHGVTLLNCTAFPLRRGKAKVTMVPAESEAFLRALGASGIAVSAAKDAFLIQGEERPGAVAEQLKKLADSGINVTACNATIAEGGTFGMILWVSPRDVDAAAKALGAP